MRPLKNSNSMLPATISLLIFLLFAASQSAFAEVPNDSVETIKSLLKEMAQVPPDPCGQPWSANSAAKSSESSLLQKASEETLSALNEGDPESSAARDRAAAALKKIERLSDEINAGWPQESRFHFQILDIAPALVLKIGIRAQEMFFLLGIPEKDGFGKPNREWRVVGRDDLELDHPAPRNWIEISPLRRGPSGKARFLASIGYTGCAGSSGVLYDAREWDPSGLGELDTVIKQEGAQGMDEGFTGGKPTRKDPFAPIGQLETGGPLITLPYCWFSAIDTWDNPSICALDTYDVSGDSVKFYSRTYNRPDLVPIVKAIEYAEKHDYPAVLAYCADADLARRMVRDITTSYFAGDLQVTRKADGSELIEMGGPNGDRFTVKKSGDRWLIVGYKPGAD